MVWVPERWHVTTQRNRFVRALPNCINSTMVDKEKRGLKLFGSRISSIFSLLDNLDVKSSSRLLHLKLSSGSLRPLAKPPLLTKTSSASLGPAISARPSSASQGRQPSPPPKPSPDPRTMQKNPVLQKTPNLDYTPNLHKQELPPQPISPQQHHLRLLPQLRANPGGSPRRKLTRRPPPPDWSSEASPPPQRSMAENNRHMEEGLNDIIGTLEQEIGLLMNSSNDSQKISHNHQKSVHSDQTSDSTGNADTSLETSPIRQQFIDGTPASPEFDATAYYSEQRLDHLRQSSLVPLARNAYPFSQGVDPNSQSFTSMYDTSDEYPGPLGLLLSVSGAVPAPSIKKTHSLQISLLSEDLARLEGSLVAETFDSARSSQQELETPQKDSFPVEPELPLWTPQSKRNPLKATPTYNSMELGFPRVLLALNLVKNFHRKLLLMSSIFSTTSNRNITLAQLKRSISFKPGEGQRSSYVQTIRRNAGTAFNDLGPETWRLPIGILPIDRSQLLLNDKFSRHRNGRGTKASGVGLKHGHLAPRLLAAEVDEVAGVNKFGSLGRSNTHSQPESNQESPQPQQLLLPPPNVSRQSSLARTVASNNDAASWRGGFAPLLISRQNSVASRASVNSVNDYRLTSGYYQHPGYGYDDDDETDVVNDLPNGTIHHEVAEEDEPEKPRLMLVNPDASSDSN